MNGGKDLNKLNEKQILEFIKDELYTKLNQCRSTLGLKLLSKDILIESAINEIVDTNNMNNENEIAEILNKVSILQIIIYYIIE